MSTPTTAPASWLDAAAKLDALLGDKVPLVAGKDATDDFVDRSDETSAASLPFPGRRELRLPEPTAPEAGPRPRITPPIAAAVPGGAADEVDLAWHGYSPLAVLPSTLGLAAMTAVAVLALRPFVAARDMHVAVEGPLAALWLLLSFRAAYRLMAYNYRLTTRRLFRERGRLYRPEPPIDLATVIAVETAQNRLERWLGVGTVLVVPEDATPEAPWIEFIGVRRPKALAEMIDAAAKGAHEGNVTAARIPGEAG